MTRRLPGKGAKFTITVLFCALFAIMFGFGTGHLARYSNSSTELSSAMAFDGPVSEDQLALSNREKKSLNKCCERWRSFSIIAVELSPKGRIDAVKPETLLSFNVRIHTASDHNIIMRKKQVARKELVPSIVHQVDHAGREYSYFNQTPGKKTSGVKTIQL